MAEKNNKESTALYPIKGSIKIFSKCLLVVKNANISIRYQGKRMPFNGAMISSLVNEIESCFQISY